MATALSAATLMSTSMNQTLPHMDQEGYLLLVNRQFLISSNYKPEMVLTNIKGTLRYLRPEAAEALEELAAACKKDTKKTLVAISGFREFEKQERIFDNKVKSVGSIEKAYEYVAPPGSSEHQTGLVMDVGQSGSSTGLVEAYKNTATGKWVKDNAHLYGFIIRFQEGWEDITGYNYEPWHLRYVGVEAATFMYENQLPMETYMEDVRVSVLVGILEQTK